VAAIAFFLTYETVAVMADAMLLAVGLGCGVTAMWTASSSARIAAILPIGLGAALAPALLSGRLKTLASEVLVIAALSSCVLPLAVAGGSEWMLAGAGSLVWFVSFILGTIAVHAIKARHKPSFGSAWTVPATPVLGLVTVGAGALAALTAAVPANAALALLPAGAVTLFVGVVPIHPRRLKRVGWSLVAANVVALLLLLSA
jgi:hypothetical protein